MTSEEFKAIRRATGQTEIEFGRSLGYTGSDSTVHRLIRRMERGEKEITAMIAIKALELKEGLG